MEIEMVTDIIDGHFDDIARDSRALIQKRKAEEIKWGDPDSKDLKASKSALIKAVKKMDAKQIAVLDYMLKRSGQNDFASLLMNMAHVNEYVYTAAETGQNLKGSYYDWPGGHGLPHPKAEPEKTPEFYKGAKQPFFSRVKL
tara:strand:+ start:2826 stop:3251 length:426 start_codon:yes stop_codon:yes gene_type:complete